MIYYLRPNHLITTDEFVIFELIVFYEENPNKYYAIIPFVFQVLALLFYFEILELNFWGLNKNTTKNIRLREEDQNENRESFNSEIELKEQYIVDDKFLKNSYEEKEFLNDEINANENMN